MNLNDRTVAKVAALGWLALIVSAGLASAKTTTVPPEGHTKDWIMLTSGEWLRGSINGLREDVLYFDSDEMDDQSLDWGDIAEIHSPRTLTWYFEDLGSFVGQATLVGDTITIVSVDGQSHELPRARLFSTIEGQPSEMNYWSGKAHAGIVQRSGNTDQADLNALLHLRRETTITRADFDYTSNFGRINGEENIDNQDMRLKFDYLLSRVFFVTPFSTTLFRDKFQNIDFRGTYGAGVGIHILRHGPVEWDLSIGAAYQNTKFTSVEEGSDAEETGSITPATAIETDLTSDVELDFNYNAQIGTPDVRNTNHHAAAILSVDAFGDIITLDVTLNWDHVQTPRANADGIVPKRNDFRTAFGFGVDF